MANVIVEIHGLGNKPPRNLLERWWKLAMIEGLRANGYEAKLPKYEMVYWADILHDRPLNKFEKNEKSPYYLDEVYVKRSKVLPRENHDTRKKVIHFISKQLNRIFLNDDFSLNYSFLTDAILSNYFKDLEAYYKEERNDIESVAIKSKDQIRLRLLRVLEKYRGDDIMLVAHSMGSIVAFDVLTFLAADIPIHTLVTIGSPLGLPIVVSKIAAEHRQRMNGENFMQTPPTVLKNWYNFSDILDKVAINYELGDDFSENEHGVKPIDFLVENNYQIKGVPNPHKSFGYLRTPEFSEVLNQFILAEELSLGQKLARKTNQILKTTKIQLNVQQRKVRNWFRP